MNPLIIQQKIDRLEERIKHLEDQIETKDILIRNYKAVIEGYKSIAVHHNKQHKKSKNAVDEILEGFKIENRQN